MTKYNKSIYIPENRAKYLGKTPPICRSRWERVFARHCDRNPNVLKWASEYIVIPYFDPVKKKDRKYYTDFYLELKDGRKVVIEIKPNKELSKPRKTTKKKKSTLLYEQLMYTTNQAKWKYAREYCRKRNMEFKIITEKIFSF